MTRIILAILLTIPVYTMSGCSSMPSCCLISPPKIQMTGSKTVVERQIIGEYKELEKDAWIISSTKTTLSRSRGTGTISGRDKELFKAQKVREFHTDKIRKYKDEGAIGENNTGLIAYRPIPRYEKDKNYKRLLLTLIKEENKARTTIFTRTLKLQEKDANKQQLAAFGKIFAEEQRALAQKNDWIQETSGKWSKKK